MLPNKGMIIQGMYLCWLIWTNRNECLYKLVCRSPVSVILMAPKLEKEFNVATNRICPVSKERSREQIPPLENCDKLNVDTAYYSAANEATLGVVATNSRAEISFSKVTKVLDIESPLHAEMKATIFGLQVARESEYNSIIVESDYDCSSEDC